MLEKKKRQLTKEYERGTRHHIIRMLIFGNISTCKDFYFSMLIILNPFLINNNIHLKLNNSPGWVAQEHCPNMPRMQVQSVVRTDTRINQ